MALSASIKGAAIRYQQECRSSRALGTSPHGVLGGSSFAARLASSRRGRAVAHNSQSDDRTSGLELGRTSNGRLRESNVPPQDLRRGSRQLQRAPQGRDVTAEEESEARPPSIRRASRPAPANAFNGVFLLLLLNVAVFVADHVLKLPAIKWLYLNHASARWYQFVTSTFCHASWNHLSSNLFFLYIFGRLVEEEEGSVGLWATYLVTGAGANVVSWLVLPSTIMSVGASGAVFGLFAVSVLTKLQFNWRKLLEVVILGQFVIERVMVEAQSSAMLVGGGRRNILVHSGANHVAHLAGALVGVLLIWLVSRIPEPQEPPSGARRPKDA